MIDEPIPGWAVELTKQITILNEKLPNHIVWTETEIQDHEFRIRSIERFLWVAMGASGALGGAIGAIIAKMMI